VARPCARWSGRQVTVFNLWRRLISIRATPSGDMGGNLRRSGTTIGGLPKSGSMLLRTSQTSNFAGPWNRTGPGTATRDDARTAGVDPAIARRNLGPFERVPNCRARHRLQLLSAPRRDGRLALQSLPHTIAVPAGAEAAGKSEQVVPGKPLPGGAACGYPLSPMICHRDRAGP